MDSITTITEAKILLIDAGVSHALSLDWAHFGTINDDSSDIAYAVIAAALRHTKAIFKLDVLDEEDQNENELLDLLSLEAKTPAKAHFWYVLTVPAIDPPEALITRDWITLKSVDAIATYNRLDRVQVNRYFQSVHPDYRQTTLRIKDWLAHRRNENGV